MYTNIKVFKYSIILLNRKICIIKADYTKQNIIRLNKNKNPEYSNKILIYNNTINITITKTFLIQFFLSNLNIEKEM